VPRAASNRCGRAPDREEGLYDVLGDGVVSAQIRRAKE
jgi:hypothetical protein